MIASSKSNLACG